MSVKVKLDYELEELTETFDHAWGQWLEDKIKEGFNLHIYCGDHHNAWVQFNDFHKEFIFCASLDELIKSAIDCNEGKDDLLVIAKDLISAAETLTKAAKKQK